MRSSHVGGVVNLRADIPMFSLDRSQPSDGSSPIAGTSTYLVPVSLNVGLAFQ